MRKVTHVKLHGGLFIPGLGTLGDTLPPSVKVIPNLDMTLNDSGGIVVKWSGGEALVGAANVIVALLAPETASKK